MDLQTLKSKLREKPLSAAAYLKLASALRESQPPQLELALEACSAARSVYPMSPVVLVATGVIEAELGKTEAARATLQLVTESPLKNSVTPEVLSCALFALAKCAHSQMLLDDAEALLRKCMRATPKHLAARVMLASLQEQRRDVHAASLTLKEACAECDGAEDRVSLGEAHLTLARLQHGLGFPEEALKHYHTAGELGYKPSEAFIAAGSLSSAMGKWNDAIASLTRAVEMDRSNCAAMDMLGLAQAAVNNDRAAEEIWRERISVEASSLTYANLGMLAQKRGDPSFVDLYENSLKRAAEEVPEEGEEEKEEEEEEEGEDGGAQHPAKKKSRTVPEKQEDASLAVYNNIAVELLQRRMFSAAYTALLVAVEADPHNPRILYNLAMAHIADRRYVDAIQLFLLVVEADPDFSQAHNNLGVALHRSGHLNFALFCFATAHQLEPTVNQYPLNMARVLLDLGDVDDASSVLNSCTEDAQKFALLAGLAMVKGDHKLASKMGHKSLEIQETTEALYFVGSAFQNAGLIKEARDAYLRLLFLEPTHAFAAHNLGMILLAEGNYEEAVQRFQRAIQLQPGFAPSFCSLGHALAKLGQGKPAVVAYQRCIELDPNNVLAYQLWGDVLLDNNQEEGALRCFRIAAQLSPQNSKLQLQTGLLHEHLRSHDDAALAYKEAIHLDPSNVNALCALGLLLVRSSKDTQRALGAKCFARIAELDSTHPAAMWYHHMKKSDPAMDGGAKAAEAAATTTVAQQ